MQRRVIQNMVLVGVSFGEPCGGREAMQAPVSKVAIDGDRRLEDIWWMQSPCQRLLEDLVTY